jgi:hypothetical protein
LVEVEHVCIPKCVQRGRIGDQLEVLFIYLHRLTFKSGESVRLTQRNRREAQGGESLPKVRPAPRPGRICLNCGEDLKGVKTYCKRCGEQISMQRMPDVARLGRVVAQAPVAQAKRSATQRINGLARYAWRSSGQPNWLTERYYVEKIRPVLPTLSGAAIAKALKVSRVYANHIRKGRLPHPRHWPALAKMAGQDLIAREAR